MSRFRCAVILALAGMLAFPAALAAAGPHGLSGYRCVQYGSRFSIPSSRERFSRHGAAWRHDQFALSGYFGGPGIRRNYSLGWGVRGPACYWVGGEACASPVSRAQPVAAYSWPRSETGQVDAARSAGPWGLLGAGRFTEARRLFAIAALRDGGDAAAMAGFALASAFRGEFDAATTAMRTAIETDAAILRGLPEIGDLLRDRVRAAAEAATARSQRDPSRGGGEGDPAFLAAGMYWLLDDQAAAMAAVLAAAFAGDDAPSTRILYRELSVPPEEPRVPEDLPAEPTADDGPPPRQP